MNIKMEEIKEELKPNQIELYNGKIITLNDQQVTVLEDIKLWMSIKSELFYTLSGYAGTGKTTIIREAIKNAPRLMNIAVSAPTHKAKKVIAKASGKESYTIQSLLGLQPNTDIDNFNINRPSFDSLKEPKIGDYNLIIIDEASMLNSDLFKLLTDQAKYFKVKILFMGDDAQLPPVRESISQVFINNIITRKSKLTKVERQADSNPLMFIYDAIRSNISSNADMFSHASILTEEEEGAEFIKDVNIFKDKVINTFKSQDYKNNKDHAKLVSWTNAQVKVWNKVIRNAIFGKDVRVLEEGDLLLSYISINGTKSNMLLENSAEYEVKEVIEANKFFDFGANSKDLFDVDNQIKIEGYNVVMRDNDSDEFSERTLFIVNPNVENYKQFLKIFNDRLNYAKRWKGKAWRSYYQFKESCLLLEDIRDGRDNLIVKKDLDYGYAITVHKSQGSTYNTVFITENVIDQNPVIEERNKLKYVALSRPSKLAVILTDKAQ